MLNDFKSTSVSQLNLLDDTRPRPDSDALMKVLDGIIHSGLGKVWFTGRGTTPEWQMKREMLFLAYTTRWGELSHTLVKVRGYGSKECCSIK